MRPPHVTPTLRLLINVVSAAVVLRLLKIQDESLWVDEGVTWANATRGSWSDTVVAEANHPPLWWLVTRAVAQWAGDGPLALRAPAAVLSALSVVLAYLLAKRLLDPARTPSRGGFLGLDAGAPMWIAALSAASAFSIEYAQEARMYAALLAESLGLTLLYLRWLDRGRRGTLVAYAALATLALYTHYFAAWPILAHAAHALVRLRSRRGDDVPAPSSPIPLLAAQGVAFLLFVPWLVHLLGSYRRVAMGEAFDPFGRLANALWRMGTGPGIEALDRPRVEAGWKSVLADAWPLVVGTALAWGVPIAFGVRRAWRDRGLRTLVATTVALPSVLLLAISPWFPLIHEKYLIFAWPLLLLLAVLGARSAPRFLRPVLLGGLVALHAVGILAYHAADAEPVARALSGGHPYGKEQWDWVHHWIRRRAQPGDLVLLHGRWEAIGGPGKTTPLLEPVWSYYDRGGLASTYLPESALSGSGVESHVPGLYEAGRVFLVLSHEETVPKDHYAHVLGVLLGARGYVREDARVASRSWGIRVFEWVKPTPP
jgi:uncharacterized membrane protein